MQKLRRVHHHASSLCLVHATLLLLYALLLSSVRTSAQTVCGVAQTSPIRVDNATGTGSLRAAVNCTGGGEVEADWTGIVTVDVPISIAEGTFLSVTGGDALAEAHAGGSPTRLFEVSSGGGLTLTRLKLWGGSAASGGAIFSESATLTLDNCTFDNNIATDGNGGAVRGDGGNVTIVGGEFLGNRATRYGGAVHAIDGELVVKGGSRFEDNKSIGGGALFCGLSEVGSDKQQPAVCNITEAEFVSNTAARAIQDEEYKLEELGVVGFTYLDGGGAAMFLFANVDITDSVFSGNDALLSGGALHGGLDTRMSINACTFVNNTAGKYAGAISASSMTLGGGTQVTNNWALDDGGAMFGWDTAGTIIFDDMNCTKNWATINGGCFYGMGRAIFNDGVTVLDNEAFNGGCIYASEGANISVSGGTFTCRSSSNGGFLYAGDNTRVKITGALVEHNVAGKRGGAVYCNGDGVSTVTIEGGTFRHNMALESGGVIAFWGAPTLVTITGGTFSNNSATFYGGFAFLEAQANITCEGVTIKGHYAGEQGGGIYAREATLVKSSCDLVDNESPQGAALYMTNVKSATFENHRIADNLASGGSVVYMTASHAIARGVTFQSCIGFQDDWLNRAIQLDGDATLTAEGCVFDGWLGDTVIYHKSAVAGSLILDSCDFSGSSAAMAVISPHSDAEIRNAVVGDRMFANASTLSSSMKLVDRALDCSVSNVCGAGECVNSTLGVLCECLQSGECLNDGSELFLKIETPPAAETFSPDLVSYELVVSSAADGTTYTIWNLMAEGGDLHLDIVPSSGVLSPNGTVVVKVVGTPTKQDVGGNLTSSFELVSVSNTSAGSTVGVRRDVVSTLYLCPAFEYANPPDSEDGRVLCEQCATIAGGKGVYCDTPGATLASLPIRPGYWRSTLTSRVVHRCLNSEACIGNTRVSGSDDYCKDGYKGPYCSVCTKGYARSLSNACHSCNGVEAGLLIAACAFFAFGMLLMLVLSAVFLVGGLDAVQIVRQSVISNFYMVTRTSRFWRRMPETNLYEQNHSEVGARLDARGGVLVPETGVKSDVHRGSVRTRTSSGRGPPSVRPKSNNPNWTHPRPPGVTVEVNTGVSLPRVRGTRAPSDEATPSGRRHAQRFSHAGAGVTEAAVVGVSVEVEAGGKSKNWGLAKKVKHWSQRLPLNKIKILVGVWQILAVFSSITGVEFPVCYAVFLSWINVLNFDLGYIVSASCVLPSVNFYHSLLATTLGPFVAAAGLVLTYRMANRRAGIGSAGIIARRAAWSRHVAAGLLLTFVVFTSASSTAFKTFACDNGVMAGHSYLRADYSISCKSRTHGLFKVYAGIMIAVYPIGIPALYSYVLWKYRELLNPRIYSGGTFENDGVSEEDMGAGFARTTDAPSAILLTASNGQTKAYWSPQELKELDERVQARAENPELVPFMFLWRDFGPDLYYYEVVECGRRILLTEALIFIAPHTSIQAAMACIFAFVSLMGFELMRPHADPADSWLYRLGCVMIFMSYFLALLIKMDATGAANRSALGGTLVAVNVLLIIAVLWTAWFAIRQVVDGSHDEDTTSAK